VTFFSQFALSFGLMLALMAVIAAWVFRSSTAPLAFKLVLPTLLVGLACAAPFEVNTMMGLPVSVSTAALPEKAELLAFLPHDEARLVDLWLLSGDGPPRSYETRLDEGMKKVLRRAQDEMAQGRPAMLKKRSSKAGDRQLRPGEQSDFPDDQTEYVLDDSARSTLPPKE
jgi:hypothetical protein